MSETVNDPTVTMPEAEAEPVVEVAMPEAEAPRLCGPKGEIGPVLHEETGEYTHWGEHSTQIIHGGGNIVTISHGESFTPAKDGAPAVVFRRRDV